MRGHYCRPRKVNIYPGVRVLTIFNFRHIQLLLSSILPSVHSSSLPPSFLCDSGTDVYLPSCWLTKLLWRMSKYWDRGNMEVSIFTSNAPHHIQAAWPTYSILLFKETLVQQCATKIHSLPENICLKECFWMLHFKYVSALILNFLKCLKRTYSCVCHILRTKCQLWIGFGLDLMTHC